MAISGGARHEEWCLPLRNARGIATLSGSREVRIAFPTSRSSASAGVNGHGTISGKSTGARSGFAIALSADALAGGLDAHVIKPVDAIRLLQLVASLSERQMSPTHQQ